MTVGTMDPKQMARQMLGVAKFYGSENGTWVRRSFPLFLRFACNAPVIGSAMGIVNIYIGLGKSIIAAQKEMRSNAKYWAFLHAMQWGAAQIGKSKPCARLRLIPGRAILDLRQTAKIQNHRKGGIEVTSRSLQNQFEKGVKDAIEAYNRLMEGTEKAVAKKLIQTIGSGASYAERQNAYHSVAKEMRAIAARGMYMDFSDKLPARHVRALLNC